MVVRHSGLAQRKHIDMRLLFFACSSISLKFLGSKYKLQFQRQKGIFVISMFIRCLWIQEMTSRNPSWFFQVEIFLHFSPKKLNYDRNWAYFSFFFPDNQHVYSTFTDETPIIFQLLAHFPAFSLPTFNQWKNKNTTSQIELLNISIDFFLLNRSQFWPRKVRLYLGVVGTWKDLQTKHDHLLSCKFACIFPYFLFIRISICSFHKNAFFFCRYLDKIWDQQPV